MKTIFVTGCCGFIGYKVSEMLLEQGFSVIGIDDMNDYYDPRLKQWKLSLLSERQDSSNFTFYRSDITDYKSVETVFSNHNIDAVINLAARAGVRASVENPWAYLDTNVKGTLNLLECCKNFSVKKFVFASTSSVYGNNKKTPFDVLDNTDGCLAPYSATKKAGEVLCHSFHYLYDLDITIPRYFTVYGPAGRPDMSIFRFIKNIGMGKPIKINGDGRQKRDFTYIDDIAAGTLKCLKKVGFGIFNLGNDRPIELMYVVQAIEKTLGKKAQIQFSPRHPADVINTWADISMTKEMLDWSPATNIEDGIEKTVRWHMLNRDFVNSLND